METRSNCWNENVGITITRKTVSKIKKKCSFDDIHIHSFLEDLRSGRPIECDEKEETKILEATTNPNFSFTQKIR